LLLGVQASSAQTYTFDGRTLQRWQGDSRTLKVSEWQIWLYKRGQATGAANHWGAISASSADKALASLKSGQDFEQRYCKFLGKPQDCEQNMTYFNPLGPIAIMERGKTLPQRIDIALWDLNETRERFKNLMKLYSGLNAAYNPYSYTGLGTTPNNPFQGVGAFVMDYGASLKAALDKVKLAAEQLYALNNTNERDLESSLDQFDAVAKDQRERVSALESDSTEIQSRYATLAREGVLNPTSSSGSASWMHIVNDNGDGDQIKKITIDVSTTSNAILIRKVNSMDDSSETIETRMPFASISSAVVIQNYSNLSATDVDSGGHFGLTGTKVFTVHIRGNSYSAFSELTKSSNGSQQQKGTGSYILFFTDGNDANACADFINSKIPQRN
jgi:hypothetical protein